MLLIWMNEFWEGQVNVLDLRSGEGLVELAGDQQHAIFITNATTENDHLENYLLCF